MNTPSAPIDRKVATAAAAVGLVALGLLSLVYRDLLLQWQPAPKTAPWRMPVALVSGVVLLLCGVGLSLPRFRRAAATLAAAWIALWMVALNVPATIAANGSVATLLGVAECAAMALGLGILAMPPEARRYKRVLVAAFGLCAVVFGVSHFVYADFTATMVPPWVPQPLVVAYLTGAIHAAIGVCLLFGFLVPLAAWIETMMMGSFVLLLHVPRVIEKPTDRLELTMLAIAILLTSAAWIVAASTREAARASAARVPA